MASDLVMLSIAFFAAEMLAEDGSVKDRIGRTLQQKINMMYRELGPGESMNIYEQSGFGAYSPIGGLDYELNW